MKQLPFLDKKYEYFILTIFDPLIIKNRYDKVLVFDLTGAIQFYSGSENSPTCSLYLDRDEIQSVTTSSTRIPNVDLFQIRRRDGKTVSIYGYGAA